MRKMSITAAIMMLTTSYAAASDPVQTIVTEDEITVGYDWSGAYIGANIGYGWGKSKFADSEYNGGFSVFPAVHWDVKSKGLRYGLQAGYNVQRDSFVYGVEGEFGYHRSKGSRLQPGVDTYGDPYDATGTVKGGLYGGLSLRLGYAFDRTLVFAKAGGVYSSAELGFIDTCTIKPCGLGIIDAVDKLGFGYQLGLGVERALSEKWTIKAEYAFSDFGKAKPNAVVIGSRFDQQNKGVSADLVDHSIRIGLNYRF